MIRLQATSPSDTEKADKLTDPERDQLFRSLLRKHTRIAIAGVPRAGKTTLTTLVTDREVVHTDDYIRDERGHDDWDGCPERCAKRCPTGALVIEGVRALAVMKLLKEPITCVVWLNEPHRKAPKYTPKQHAAAEGRRTNFAKWLREARGVEVVRL